MEVYRASLTLSPASFIPTRPFILPLGPSPLPSPFTPPHRGLHPLITTHLRTYAPHTPSIHLPNTTTQVHSPVYTSLSYTTPLTPLLYTCQTVTPTGTSPCIPAWLQHVYTHLCKQFVHLLPTPDALEHSYLQHLYPKTHHF